MYNTIKNLFLFSLFLFKEKISQSVYNIKLNMETKICCINHDKKRFLFQKKNKSRKQLHKIEFSKNEPVSQVF